MPDETITDTGSADEAGSTGDGESGGAAQSAQATAAGGDATDWKAKFEELERKHAKVTGKAGSAQSDLQRELGTEKQARAVAEAKASAAEKKLRETEVLDEVLAKAPAATRAAIRLAARGIIPGVAEPDPKKAAEAVLKQIEADAPDLVKPPVATHARVGNGEARSGFVFTKGGERVF